MPENGETAPLLADNVPNLARDNEVETALARVRRAANVRAIVYSALTAIFVVALVTLLFFWDKAPVGVGPGLPSDPYEAALVIMDKAPVIVSSPWRVTPIEC